MPRILRFATLALFLFSVHAGIARAEEHQEQALAKLQGEWKADSWVIGGREESIERLRRSYRIKERKMILVTDGKDDGAAVFKINVKATPHHIDITYSTGALNGKAILGIYKFKNGQFVNCFAPPGEERPTEFKSTPENQYFLSIDRRINKRSDEP